MELNYFDIIAGVIILLLGLKGVINGFFKELFGLIGIIGGIFIASRVGDSVGKYLSELLFKFDNPSAISFTGFLATLGVFWILMLLVGSIFKKLSSLSGLGAFDRALGFVFGTGKFFLIAAVIAHATFNVQALKPALDSFMKSSILFPILVESGSYIMKIDTSAITKDINKTMDEAASSMQKEIQTKIETSQEEVTKRVKDELETKLPEIVKEIENEDAGVHNESSGN